VLDITYNSLDFVILELELIISALYFVNALLGYIIVLLEMELDFFKIGAGCFSSLVLKLEHELDFCYVAPAHEMMKSSAFIFTV
jgi:hypothetical protein